MELLFSTSADVEAYLGHSRGILIPLGSIEQHGPDGLIGTDTLCADAIARRIASAGEILVGPAIPFVVAPFNLAFPGTISMRSTTLMALIEDYLRSLMRHGFERFYFLNGHGGNVATIEATFAEIYAEWSFVEERPPFVMKLRNWWDLPGVHGLCNRLFPTGHGMHATPSEIAVTQAAYPDRIKTADYAPRIAPSGPIRDALDYRARFPDGRIGSDPAQASPEHGRTIIDAAVPALLKDVADFTAEVLPEG